MGHSSNSTEVEEILEERKSYGNPKLLAIFAQNTFQNYMALRRGKHGNMSDEDKAHDEMMHMIIHKIARIATGDFVEDNYIDIAGYASLAKDMKTKMKGNYIHENNT